MVPAEGYFMTASAKGDHKANESQDQTGQHSRFINLLGAQQICIGMNKTDCNTLAYRQVRYGQMRVDAIAARRACWRA